MSNVHSSVKSVSDKIKKSVNKCLVDFLVSSTNYVLFMMKNNPDLMVSSMSEGRSSIDKFTTVMPEDLVDSKAYGVVVRVEITKDGMICYADNHRIVMYMGDIFTYDENNEISQLVLRVLEHVGVDRSCIDSALE